MQKNFDVMRHPTEDHSLCSMDVIDELIDEYNQFDSGSNNVTILVEVSNMLEGVGFVMGDANSTHINGVLNCPNSDNHGNNPANLMNIVCRKEDELEYLISARVQVVEITRPTISKGATNTGMDAASRSRDLTNADVDSAYPIPTPSQGGPLQLKADTKLAYSMLTPYQDDLLQPRAYSNLVMQGWKQTEAVADPAHLIPTLDLDQQLPIIISNNLDQEQEEKLLTILRQHKKSIGRKLLDLPRINPSICMHRILMEEEARPIR
ncbi:hypothetical protein CR513_10554, partial [Mucuna pruriens]